MQYDVEYNGSNQVTRTCWLSFGFDNTVSRKSSPFVLTVYSITTSKCKATSHPQTETFLTFIMED